MKIYSKKHIVANRGSLEDMLNAVEDRIDELESGVDSASKISSDDMIDAASRSSEDTYLDELSQAVQNDIKNEVNDLDIQTDGVGEAVVVVINYMGNIIEFNVPFADLSMGSDIEGDSAYIGNSIRQELNNLSEGETL